jgi:hypothetical protein
VIFYKELIVQILNKQFHWFKVDNEEERRQVGLEIEDSLIII